MTDKYYKFKPVPKDTPLDVFIDCFNYLFKTYKVYPIKDDEFFILKQKYPGLFEEVIE